MTIESFLFELIPKVLVEVSKLDGCYALKTDLPTVLADKEMIHDRYKDLALVEKAFRTCKTARWRCGPSTYGWKTVREVMRLSSC